MDKFSSNEKATMEKIVENGNSHIIKTKPPDINQKYEIDKIVDFVKSNGFKTVCLQFPDHLLRDSCEVAKRLKESLKTDVYIAADSNYESCCVDYLTAQHVNADVIIHFGARCSSSWTETIPCLCIYEKKIIDVDYFLEILQRKFPECFEVFLKFDSGYLHAKSCIENKLTSRNFKIAEKLIRDGNGVNIYIGENDRNLLNFQLGERVDLYYYDPSHTKPQLTQYNINGIILKRRNFLIEKIKDSRRVGIVIGTLVIKNFLKAIERVKTLLKLHNKKYYVLSVGRPNVAKLANFPEMDVYVVVCCPFSNIFENRDFYKPIVTLHDVEMALNPTNNLNKHFTYGIDDDLLQKEIESKDINVPDVSLISGNLRWKNNIEDKIESGKEIAVKDKGIVALSKDSGAEFLSQRSFKGLEQKLGETEVKLAEEGRRGIAANYENELF